MTLKNFNTCAFFSFAFLPFFETNHFDIIIVKVTSTATCLMQKIIYSRQETRQAISQGKSDQQTSWR